MVRAEGADGHVSFRTLSAQGELQDIFYSSSKKSLPITVNPDVRSPYYDYTGPLAGLAFFRLVAGPDGKPVPQPVGQVDLTALGKRPLLLFMPNPGKPGTYLVRGFSDTSADVPPGGYRFINLTVRQIGIVLGDKKVVIPPDGDAIMVNEASGGRAVTQVLVYGLIGDVAKAVYSSIWSYNVKFRHVIIVAPSDENPSGVLVKCLPESVNNIPKDEPSVQ